MSRRLGADGRLRQRAALGLGSGDLLLRGQGERGGHALRIPHQGRGRLEDPVAIGIGGGQATVVAGVELDVLRLEAELDALELRVLRGLGGLHHEYLAEALERGRHPQVHAGQHLRVHGAVPIQHRLGQDPALPAPRHGTPSAVDGDQTALAITTGKADAGDSGLRPHRSVGTELQRRVRGDPAGPALGLDPDRNGRSIQAEGLPVRVREGGRRISPLAHHLNRLTRLLRRSERLLTLGPRHRGGRSVYRRIRRYHTRDHRHAERGRHSTATPKPSTLDHKHNPPYSFDASNSPVPTPSQAVNSPPQLNANVHINRRTRHIPPSAAGEQTPFPDLKHGQRTHAAERLGATANTLDVADSGSMSTYMPLTTGRD